MSHLNVLDNSEEMSMAKFFELEKEEWRSKMIGVYADQHPYTFYVTAGHDFEDMILKIVDLDAPARELNKLKPFENLKKISEVDRKAEKDFHELLTEMEKDIPTPDSKKALEQKKKECAKLFKMFDQTVSVCEEYFELEYEDCSKRVDKQVNFQKPVITEVEKFLLEVEEFGNAELKALQDSLAKWIYDKGSSMLENTDQTYNLLTEQPFAMSVWFERSGALTSKELRAAFLTDQKETSHLWKKAFNDLLMLSAKLEKCRCNYNLMKFKLEREIFWMNRDYKENMPELTKIQRHLANFVDKKIALKYEIKNLENEGNKEQKRVLDIKNKILKKITNTKANNKFAHQTALRKFQIFLNIKKEEIYTYLSDFQKGDQFIHEEILGVSWNPIDLSHLKPDDYDFQEGEIPDGLKEIKKTIDVKKKSITDKGDDFSSAFQVLISTENFLTTLNMLADELGYILDFSWVNYVKEKLELIQEVKWVELFKVFKINFVKDLRKLKDHMISYCKFDDNGEVVFDIDGAIDGFLNYVWQKRQSSQKISSPDCDLLDCESYWSSVVNSMPKTLLWESVENSLFQYWKLLESRSNLLKAKLKIVAENNEFDSYLENYHKYGTWCL